MIEDQRVALGTRAKPREPGARLVLVDFRTGYLSLRYRQRLPVDTLKINRAFVTEAHCTEADCKGDQAAIVGMILPLPWSIRLGVIAEGVETEGDVAFLTAQSWDYAHGVDFARLVSEAEALAVVAA